MTLLRNAHAVFAQRHVFEDTGTILSWSTETCRSTACAFLCCKDMISPRCPFFGSKTQHFVPFSVNSNKTHTQSKTRRCANKRHTLPQHTGSHLTHHDAKSRSSAHVCDPGAPLFVPRLSVGTAGRHSRHPRCDQQARQGASVARLLPATHASESSGPKPPSAAPPSSHLTRSPRCFAIEFLFFFPLFVPEASELGRRILHHAGPEAAHPSATHGRT